MARLSLASRACISAGLRSFISTKTNAQVPIPDEAFWLQVAPAYEKRQGGVKAALISLNRNVIQTSCSFLPMFTALQRLLHKTTIAKFLII